MDMITDYRANHVLFQEPGLKESQLAEKYMTTRKYTGSFAASKMTRAYNVHGVSQGVRQYGGVATFTIGDPTNKIAKTETDPTELGRWCY